MINIEDRKIAIISDIHLGVHSDSETWHKIVLDYARWLKDRLTEKNINVIFILGDLFNNREEVGVKTLSVADSFFQILKDFKIKLLIGNHDCYLKDSSEITSASILRGWPNITIIDKMESIDILNKKLTFCPWGTPSENIPASDYLFGHFEINSFNYSTTRLCDYGIDSDTILSKAPLVFSGHFHLRDERQYQNGKIVYCGCPFQMNFGDTESTKGIYILDISSGDYEFIENTMSPKYYKIKMSDFVPDKIKEIKKIIPNNFIKILVDTQIDYKKFESVINSLFLLKPLELSNDFRDNGGTATTIDMNHAYVSLDTKSLLSEYVQNLDLNVSKEKLMSEILAIYDKASNNLKIASIEV